MTGDYTVLSVKVRACTLTRGNFTAHKLYLREKHHLKATTSAESEPRGAVQPWAGLAWLRGAPLPWTRRPVSPAQGRGTHISSPDFSKQISASCPRGMSSVSSGVSELDVVSLEGHEGEHSHLATSTQGPISWGSVLESCG